ncbi:MAG: nucleotidyltransferase domain-containing protein [Oscillospiraceae bacterium]|jgi:predicted nucleotidyltransferase|nr:nucleotidyltransferase domain-containing protein [Oscillospiraceae bacterium]
MTWDAALHSELNRIAEAITAILPKSKVVLFGSYARGQQGPWSDLDLAVIASELPERKLIMMDIIRIAIIDKTDKPVDILVYREDEFEQKSQKRSMLAYTIKNEGVVLNA